MAAALAVTRSKSYIHVIGNPLEQFDGRLLLTCRGTAGIFLLSQDGKAFQERCSFNCN